MRGLKNSPSRCLPIEGTLSLCTLKIESPPPKDNLRRAGGDEAQPARAAEIQVGGAAEILPLRLHRGTDAPGHHQGAGIAEAAERTEPGCPLIRTDTATIKQFAE